ncbi:RNB domain-containing protein [Ochromonadaceae sp. CCMP2298]|nr:RNB domain-containing protein [Ochromonadaceae sp. CCMP2298]
MLELYALSERPHQAPGEAKKHAPKPVRALLKRLKLPVQSSGARLALVSMGYGYGRNRGSGTGTGAGVGGEGGYNPTFSKLKNVPVVEGATAASAVDGYVLNITPWATEVLEAAKVLVADVADRRRVISDTGMSPAGKKGPSGRMDYRISAQEHPAMCIDTKYASFYDDAFSLSPETGELLVHVVDVAGALRRHEALQSVARERISSTFLPSGPLHMLPPQALEALKLSTTGPNEVMTVALSVDFDTGAVLAFRVFASVLGPVFPIDLRTANEIIAGVGVVGEEGDGDVEGFVTSADASSSSSPIAGALRGKVRNNFFTRRQSTSNRIGYPDNVVRDLRTAYDLVSKMCAREPWLDAPLRQKHRYTELRIDKTQGTVQTVEASSEYAHRLVNGLLTLYSECAYRYCASKEVAVPLAWENRDKVDSSRPRRFATQPLRNWLSQLQQKQVRAALKMELPLSRKDCAMAVAHHNERRKVQAQVLGAGSGGGGGWEGGRGVDMGVGAGVVSKVGGVIGGGMGGSGRKEVGGYDVGRVAFASFEAHCATLAAAGEDVITLSAEGLGKGGLVRIKPFGLTGSVVGLNVSLAEGEVVEVRVGAVSPETRDIQLTLVD